MPKHDFNDYKLLVGQQAMKGYKRLLANGVVGADFEDVFQQMSLTFCVASDKFDPERGFEFSTYLVRAIWIEFNKYAESQINHRQHITSTDEYASEDGHSMYDLIASEAMMPDEATEIRRRNAKAFRGLSKHARKVMWALVNPSEELNEEWNAKKAHQMQGRKLGVSSRRLPDDMNFTFLYDQLKVPTRRRADIKRELSSAFGVSLS